MAFPKILQKLFDNGGAGPKLREDVLPDIDVGVTSVNGQTGDVKVDVGVTSVNGNKGALTPAQTGCLPLAGGTMTGAIHFTGSESIYRTDDNTGLSIYGGTGANNGAYLQAFGKNMSGNQGVFNLVASNGTNVVALRGQPDGTLLWGGKNVITDLNGIYVKETWKSSDGTKWYRKWSDGYIEQGGTVTADKSATINFPVAFQSKVLYANAMGYSATSAINPEQYKIGGKPSLTSMTVLATYASSQTHNSMTITGYWEANGY